MGPDDGTEGQMAQCEGGDPSEDAEGRGASSEQRHHREPFPGDYSESTGSGSPEDTNPPH